MNKIDTWNKQVQKGELTSQLTRATFPHAIISRLQGIADLQTPPKMKSTNKVLWVQGTKFASFS